MKRSGLFVLLLTTVFIACRNKDKSKKDDSGFFPVLSFLQSQVRHVDSSLYSIEQISKKEGIKDTSYIKREDFKIAAQDFLFLPDIAASNLKKEYLETKLYDEDLKKVVLSYAPKNKEMTDGIVRQDVLIEPDAGAGDQVQTIYVETVLSKADSTVLKRMTWNVDKNFQVLRIINKKGQPEKVEVTDVNWTNYRSAE